MNSRSGIFTFLLFVLLFGMIGLQILSMIQSDRLYERLNTLLEQVSSRQISKTINNNQSTVISASKLPMPEYSGDEGDWLVWQLGGEPLTLNPISSSAETSTRYITSGSIFETLMQYDPDDAKLKPWLAESYEVSKDGLEYIVKLREGICFSDGVPITADDVLFTYETIMNPGVDAATQRIFYQNFKEVKKIDDRTIKFTLNEVYWKTFEAIGLFEVLPKHIYKYDSAEQFNKRRSEPFGSGPYVFERWDSGQQLVLKRNENYWGNKPKINKIVFRFITNETASLQALRSNDVDYMIPTSDQYSALAKDKEFNEKFHVLRYWAPGVPVFFIAWNEETPFFKDVRVRKAMTHIVDRETIAKYLMKGEVEIATGPFYIYGRQNDPNVKPWPYDLKKAGQLLDEAGWIDHNGDGIRDKDGVPFKFKFAYSTGQLLYEQLAKLLKEAGAQVGIDITPDPYEWSVFIERYQTHQFEALCIGSGGTIEFDPYQYFHSSQIANRGDNVTSYNNPEVDKLLDEARRTIDENKRYELYHKFHRILHEEEPFTFLFMRPERRFLDKRFENVKIHKLGLYELEWYVPKDKQRYK